MSCHRTIIRLSAVLAVVALATGCGDGDSPSAPPTPEPARPTTVTVSPAKHELTALGTTVQLSAEVRDQNARVMAGATVTWTSSASSMATVDASGLVTAAGNGTATITASAGSASGSAVVTVMQSVASVEVSPSVDELTALGQTVQLTAEAFDENGEAVAGVEFSWESSDAAIATVDAGGLVTGVAVGTATITASVGGAQGTAEITVGPNPDRAALVALYEATDGQNWVNSENWLTDAPLGDWYGVDTDGSGRVVRLDLSGTREGRIPHGLTGPIPPELGKLSNLTILDLDINDLTGPIPPELGKLSNLTILDLDINDLTGPIPPELGNLSNLGYLKLSGNSLTGPIPAELGGLSLLISLDLGLNDLTGPIPAELGNLANLFALNLDGNDLTGSIPAELGSLSNLGILSLWGTGLSGSIPPELGKLTNVWYLGLIENNLSGPIPPELGNMASLSHLRLDWNQLSGPIPPELGDLAILEQLVLSSNQLSGPIPPELGSLSNLEILSLANNGLTGEIPRSVLYLPALKSLWLGSNPAGFCAARADRELRARLRELSSDLELCRDPNVRLLPSALMREDGNGMSLALPDDLRAPSSAVTISDPSVVAASIVGGWLELKPRAIGFAEVKLVPSEGGDPAIAEVSVREVVGTFGIDVFVEQPTPIGFGQAMVEAADWWSYILDGTEWPDRQAGCPSKDVFGGKARAVADELLVGARIEVLEGSSGYASGCFFPPGSRRQVPVLDPGGGYVVTGGVPNQGLARHEIGHLLGLVLLGGREEGLMTETADGEYFTGSRAVQAYRAGGGDADLPGVPLQRGGGHWHGELVGYELMGPLGGWDANAISLGALVDRGYMVDLSKALPWPWRARATAQTGGEQLARDVVWGEPRVFIERRPREPPR